jgi:hypothetical protein
MLICPRAGVLVGGGAYGSKVGLAAGAGVMVGMGITVTAACKPEASGAGGADHSTHIKVMTSSKTVTPAVATMTSGVTNLCQSIFITQHPVKRLHGENYNLLAAPAFNLTCGKFMQPPAAHPVYAVGGVFFIHK